MNQIDTCDHCRLVTETKPSGGMMLCPDCRATRCPRCGEFESVFRPEWAHYDCPLCRDSYVYREA